MGTFHHRQNILVQTAEGNVIAPTPQAIHNQGKHFFPGSVHGVDPVGHDQDMLQFPFGHEKFADLIFQEAGIGIEQTPFEADHGDMPAFFQTEILRAPVRTVGIHGKSCYPWPHTLIKEHAQ